MLYGNLPEGKPLPDDSLDKYRFLYFFSPKYKGGAALFFITLEPYLND